MNRVARNIVIAFIVAIGALTAVGVANDRSARLLAGFARAAEDLRILEDALGTVLERVRTAHLEARAVTIAGDEAGARRFEAADAEVRRALQAVRDIAPPEPPLRDAITHFVAVAQQNEDSMRQAVRTGVRYAPSQGEGAGSVDAREARRPVLEAFELVHRRLHEQLAQRRLAADRASRNLSIAIAIGTAFTVLAGGALLWGVLRGVRRMALMEADLRANNAALRLNGSELQRLGRLRAMMSGANRLLVHVDDRAALFEGVCRVAVEHGGFDSARFELALTTGVPAAAAGVADRSGAYGASFPVRVHGETIGWLCLTASEPGYFGEDELTAIGELVADVAFGVEVLDRKQQLEATAQVIERSPIVLFRYRPAPIDQFDFVSSNVARWGYTAESFIDGGRSFASVVHPEDRDAVREALARAEREGRDRIAVEHRLVTAGGARRSLQLALLAERGPGGRVVRFQGIAIDLTEQLRVEARMYDSEARTRLSEQRLREAQRIARLGDWDYEHGAALLTASAEAARMLGIPEGTTSQGPADLLGLVHPEDRERLHSSFLSAVMSQSRVEVEVRLAPREGAIRWVQLAAEPRSDADGVVSHVAGTILDVTERRRAEDQVREQLRELQRWHRVTLNREERVQGLKSEVNELLARLGEGRRYARPEALAALRERVVERMTASAARGAT